VSGREQPLSSIEARAASDGVKSSADLPAVRLLIVTGDQLMRCGLRQILEQEAGWRVMETEIIRLLVQGNTSVQTGNALGMSERTIEKQQRKIMEKLGLSKYQDLLLYAVRHFMTDPKESRAPIDTEEQSTLWPSQILSGF
jgi:DNA-binding CsgD family transcriptional regulator